VNGDDSTSERIGALDARIEGLEQDVGELKAPKPWSRHASAAMSLVAVLISLGALAYTAWRDTQQDVEADRAELRALIQSLGSLTKERIELAAEYAEDPDSLRRLTAFVDQETAVLAKGAASILQERPELGSATEYNAVAIALVQSKLLDEADELMEVALTGVQEPLDRWAIVRAHAWQRFQASNLEGGREKFQEALNILQAAGRERYAGSLSMTELWWTQAEYEQRNCHEARLHFERSTAYDVRAVSEGEQVDDYRTAVEAELQKTCG
jgi:predicted negative regulator of RcsB-dependent stress response